MKTILAAMAMLSILAAVGASALAFDQVNVETWVGDVNAANKAMLVVDFGPQSFAFGYAWNGTTPVTGFDMLSAVAAATDLDYLNNIQYDGPVVYSLSYHGYSLTYDSLNWGHDDHWWEYWTGSTETDFSSSWVGSGDRVVTNGAWDGWTWSPVYPAVGTAPDVPTVPEPCTIVALAAGLGTMIVRRRKN